MDANPDGISDNFFGLLLPVHVFECKIVQFH